VWESESHHFQIVFPLWELESHGIFGTKVKILNFVKIGPSLSYWKGFEV
jgi:hypothetical protein